jgi:hypothetical protein
MYNSSSMGEPPRTLVVRVIRYEQEGVDWVLETVDESRPKYRRLLSMSLAELNLVTVPPIRPRAEL